MKKKILVNKSISGHEWTICTDIHLSFNCKFETTNKCSVPAVHFIMAFFSEYYIINLYNYIYI